MNNKENNYDIFGEYLIRSLEHQIFILKESIKVTRQNGIILAGGIILLYSAIIQIPAPLIHPDKLKDFSGYLSYLIIQFCNSFDSFNTHKEKIELLSTVWQFSIIGLSFFSFSSFVLGIIVYFKSPKDYFFDYSTQSEIDTKTIFIELLKEELKALRKIKKYIIKVKIFGAIFVIGTISFQLIIVTLWGLFGS